MGTAGNDNRSGNKNPRGNSNFLTKDAAYELVCFC